MNIEVGKKYQSKEFPNERIEVLFIADKGAEPIFAIYDSGTTACYSKAEIEGFFQPYDEPEEKTLEQRIKEGWPDYEVRVCEWIAKDKWCYLTTSGSIEAHHIAVSKRGFYGYVYENKFGALYVSNEPFDGRLPLACLFEEVENE